MHSATLVSALLAAGALAEPIHQGHARFHKRQPDDVVVYQTDVATATATKIVTAGQAEASAPAPQGGYVSAWTSVWTVTQGASSSAPPPPPPSTTPSSTYVAPSSAVQSSAAASSSVTSTTGSTGVDYVDLHNAKRELHGASTIAHDTDLESRAKAIVGNCPGGDKDDGQKPNVGSNWAGGTNLDYAGAMKMWYDGEEAQYAQYSNNYQSEPNIPSGVDCMHFSQVIWEASTHVGCASNDACSGGTQITCLYSPQGNFAMMNNGQSDSYVQNVFPPKQAGQ